MRSRRLRLGSIVRCLCVFSISWLHSFAMSETTAKKERQSIETPVPVQGPTAFENGERDFLRFGKMKAVGRSPHPGSGEMDPVCRDRWAQFFKNDVTTLKVAFGNIADELQVAREFGDLSALEAFREVAMTPCDCFSECSRDLSAVGCASGTSDPQLEANSISRCAHARYGFQYNPPIVNQLIKRWRETLKSTPPDPIFNPDDALCGFTQDQADERVLVKRLYVPNPSAIGGYQEKEVRIVTSSGTKEASFDSFDRAADQQARETARNEFVDSICEADGVFFMGHARYGCGPDFNFSRRRPNGTINADAYRKQLKDDRNNIAAVRAGPSQTRARGRSPDQLRPVCSSVEIEERLKACSAFKSSRTQILGLFTCDAEKHFENGLKQSDQKLSTILPRGPIYVAQAFNQLRSAIEGIVAQRCEADLTDSLNRGRYTSGAQLTESLAPENSAGSPQSGSSSPESGPQVRLKNFFNP